MLVDYNAKQNQMRLAVLVSEDGTKYKGEFIDLRIDPKTIPKGKHWYHCRHDDNGDWCTPVSIEMKVLVNFCGTLITNGKLKFPDPNDKYIAIVDYWFED